MIKGFKEFLLKNNVLALALAVIVGGAIGKVVDSLAKDILMPIVTPWVPHGEWEKAKLIIGKIEISWGAFLGNVINFVIIAFAVYLITKALIKEPVPAPSKQCPRCRESIVPEATKCKYCTADI